ncbi:GNAT family N-acetyltransferase [Staphylococcus ureilyticus]|uniref:GNAT family N-acetyltransferase n=2 Tax=Staphylococcus TaxID=1279 RepID=UPI003219F3E0
MLKKRVSKMVKLRPYHTLLFSDLEKFTLLEEDRKFTKTPLENIDLANRDQERHPTLVYDDKDRCVGFFTLHEGEGVKPYSTNPNAIFFRSFSVDSQYRGFGYGKKVMEALPQYIKRYYPTINEIYLAVNTDNHLARKLYIQNHYEIVGETLLENKPVYIMKQSC